MAPSILFLDDEIRSIEAYTSLLEDEFRLHIATHSQEAIAILEREEISIIVSDMRLAGESGTDFLNVVNQRFRRPIKILLSAYVSEFFDDRFQTEYRPYAVLRKPLVSAEALLATLRQAQGEFEFRYGAPPSTSERRFLSGSQVQKRLGISKPTLYKCIRNGLPSHRVGGKRLYDWNEIDTWIRNQEESIQP